MKTNRVWLLLIFCNLFWAGNYVFGSYVVAELAPLTITFYRCLFATILLIPLAYFLEKPTLQEIKAAWRSLIAMAFLGIIGYNFILYSALEYTSAMNASLVNALNPGVIVLFSFLLLKERLSRIQLSGFLLSLLGAMVVITGGRLDLLFQLKFNIGDIYMLGAVLVWTFYSLIARKAPIRPITAICVSTFFAVMILLPIGIMEPVVLFDVSITALTGILYMAIFPAVGSFIFWTISVREIGASKAGITLNLIPVFTAIISIILGHGVTASQVIGGVLVFIGVYLTSGLLEKTISNRHEKHRLNV